MTDNQTKPTEPSAGNAVTTSREAHGMDIEKATRLYQEVSPDFVKGYESIIEFCRENRVSAPLDNGNFLHALGLTELLFDKTTCELRMLTGGHGDGFIKILLTTFREMLGRLKKNKGKARIVVVDGEPELSLLQSLEREFPGTLEVRRGASAAPIAHFIVGDFDMIRDEKVHEPLTPQTSANVIKAKVYFYNPSMAQMFGQRFDAIWNRLAPAVAKKPS